MTIPGNSINIVLAAMLAIAVYTDVVRGKVYNKLTFPCVALGLILNSLSGWNGAQLSLLGAALGFAIFVVIALSRLMGGGDAKLLLAVGALKGWQFLLSTLLYMAIAGGILAIGFMIYRRVARDSISDMSSRAFARVVLRAPVEMMPTLRAGKLPYSIAIAAGAVVAFLKIGYGSGV